MVISLTRKFLECQQDSLVTPGMDNHLRNPYTFYFLGHSAVRMHPYTKISPRSSKISRSKAPYPVMSTLMYYIRAVPHAPSVVPAGCCPGWRVCIVLRGAAAGRGEFSSPRILPCLCRCRSTSSTVDSGTTIMYSREFALTWYTLVRVCHAQPDLAAL